MSAVSTPAILLRAHPYSENSKILRFLTRDHGIQGAVAKGVRKSVGKGSGSLSTFSQGTLTLYLKDRRDLQTFKDFAPTHARTGLASHPLRLASASVLAELVLQHAGSEGNPGLFDDLAGGLDMMEESPAETILPRLLSRIWLLVRELGYAPVLEPCVECGGALGERALPRFDFASGGLRCSDCQRGAHGPRLGPGARDQLATFLRGDVPSDLQKARAHLRLASDFITYHISGGTPLRSMEVLYSMIPKPNA